MTILYFALIIAATFLFHLLVDTLVSLHVFGPIVSDKKLDEFFAKQPLEHTAYHANGLGKVLVCRQRAFGNNFQ